MPFLRIISTMFLSGTHSVSLLIFLFSAVLMIVGVGMQVWADGFNLRFLNRKAINWIETKHPHVPSLRALLVFNICALVLLLIGLQMLRGIFPFNDPFQGLNLTSLFLLVIAMVNLGELRWRGAKMVATVFIVLASLGLLALAFLSANAHGA